MRLTTSAVAIAAMTMLLSACDPPIAPFITNKCATSVWARAERTVEGLPTATPIEIGPGKSVSRSLIGKSSYIAFSRTKDAVGTPISLLDQTGNIVVAGETCPQ